MKKPDHRHRDNGFTLIEILVVMTIIGTLAGLLFTGVINSINAAKKARTSNACHQLKVSITSYYSDYRRYPLPDKPDTPYHDMASNNDLMPLLLGLDKKKNPRGTSYFSGRAARKFGKNRYINGIRIDQTGESSLWDDYGRLFGVRIDSGNTNQIPNPSIENPQLSGGNVPNWGSRESNADHSPFLTESVLVWSAGKEEDIASDNLKTWE